MKRIFYIIITLSLMSVLSLPFSFGVLAHTEGDPFVTDLIAGGGNPTSGEDVGEVRVWNDGVNLHVEYVVDLTDAYLVETHLAVGDVPGDIPQTNKNNPIPGKFDYSNHDINDVTDEYVIPLADFGFEAGDVITIAAHAVVGMVVGYETEVDLDAFAASLPGLVTIQVSAGTDSYFDVLVSGGTSIDGAYDGYCIDTDSGIYAGILYNAEVYSTYGTLPAGLVEFPENFDLVNYIINQGYVGQTSAYGTYTFGDVQRAIWALIEDDQSEVGLGSWSQDRVDEILADAYANGEGFVPGCGGNVAVVLKPVTGEQPLIIWLPVTCNPEYGDKTAWGNGTDFAGKNWAMYFEYTIQTGAVS